MQSSQASSSSQLIDLADPASASGSPPPAKKQRVVGVTNRCLACFQADKKTGEEEASTAHDEYDSFLGFIPNVQRSYHHARELPVVLNIWRTHEHRFPALAVMAGRCLPTPPTSAAPERVFWSCGFVLDRLRASELPENMAVAVFLHCSPTMIPDCKATEEAYFSKFGLADDEGEELSE